MTVLSELLSRAYQRLGDKQAFVDQQSLQAGGDPSLAADPAAAGGMDPASVAAPDMAAPVGDPATAAPPTDPAAASPSPASDPAAALAPQPLPADAAAAKPLKIDNNAIQLLILRLLARVVDHLQVPIPASDMTVLQAEVGLLAGQNGTPPAEAAEEPQQEGAIMPPQPIEPMQPAMSQKAASPVYSPQFQKTKDQVDALAMIFSASAEY